MARGDGLSESGVPSSSLLAVPSATPTLARWNPAQAALKLALFMASLFLFVLGILLLREGARALAPLVERYLTLTHPLRSFSAGWLAAMAIMSGSPVAAVSLAFLDAHLLTPLSAFTMIMGSRFGASFIVLCIGFVYVLRGRDLLTSLGMGLLSFGVTISLYVLGIFPGIWLLQSGRLQGVPRPPGTAVDSAVDLVFKPLTGVVSALLPSWAVFVIGFLIILASFALFDRCLPTQTLKRSELGKVARYIYRPVVMFLLGAAITTISMSVSLSISILVPLNDRGLVRRENVIPYIMGANITTFIDTLLASLLMSSPYAFDVVLAEMLSITCAAALLLLLAYHRYEHLMQRFVEWVTARPRHLLIFLFLLFALPILGLWL
jgi:sodium-dependent phosphate cotransporter